jgi:DNA gyrase subunit B
MNADQLWDTTLDPDTRTLLRVNVNDSMDADKLFSELMGDEPLHRRRFIQANYTEVQNLDV